MHDLYLLLFYLCEMGKNHFGNQHPAALNSYRGCSSTHNKWWIKSHVNVAARSEDRRWMCLPLRAHARRPQ
uniref:Uncharacterized protein n=1 Tax=Oryza sativa subsp. japonica TaxID=39947 RepID=Q69M20_ORYSJ|nr:hypothetical protein [Oryza sativa Japonica Group]